MDLSKVLKLAGFDPLQILRDAGIDPIVVMAQLGTVIQRVQAEQAQALELARENQRLLLLIQEHLTRLDILPPDFGASIPLKLVNKETINE